MRGEVVTLSNILQDTNVFSVTSITDRLTKALAHFGHFALCNKFLLSLASLIHLVISMYYLLQRAIRLEIYDILQV